MIIEDINFMHYLTSLDHIINYKSPFKDLVDMIPQGSTRAAILLTPPLSPRPVWRDRYYRARYRCCRPNIEIAENRDLIPFGPRTGRPNTPAQAALTHPHRPARP